MNNCFCLLLALHRCLVRASVLREHFYFLDSFSNSRQIDNYQPYDTRQILGSDKLTLERYLREICFSDYFRTLIIDLIVANGNVVVEIICDSPG